MPDKEDENNQDPKHPDKSRTQDLHMPTDTIGPALGKLFSHLDEQVEKLCKDTIGEFAKQSKLALSDCANALTSYFTQDKYVKDENGKIDAHNIADLPNACLNALKAFKPAAPRPQPAGSSDPTNSKDLNDLTEGYKMLGMDPSKAGEVAKFHQSQQSSDPSFQLNPHDVMKAFVESAGNPELAALKLAENKASQTASDPQAAPPKVKSPQTPLPTKLPPPPGTQTS